MCMYVAQAIELEPFLIKIGLSYAHPKIDWD